LNRLGVILDTYRRKAIFQLMTVLLVSLLAAVGLVAYMLYKYNPSGLYIAGNALISPEVIKEMQQQKDPLLDFSRAEFSYWDERDKQMHHVPVVLYEYEQFYHDIEKEKSENTPSLEVLELFNHQNISKLNLFVDKNPQQKQTSMALSQVVEFAYSGDYYRIHILGDERGWIYFHHPHIDQEARKYFHE
jgi:hypothetical protein